MPEEVKIYIVQLYHNQYKKIRDVTNIFFYSFYLIKPML